MSIDLVAAAGNAKVLWYVTRGSGTVALLLLTAGVVLGVLSAMRWQSRRTPRFVVSGLHRNVTLLAVVFVVIHVVTTVGDRFAPIGFRDAVLPFLSPYRPLWLGLGAVAFDLLLALIVTSLLRARIGLRLWRGVHWLAYASWPIALVHALGTGSDARTTWLGTLGFVCVGSVGLAILARITAARGPGVLRAGAALAVVVIAAGVFAWAKSGPWRPGWAARAGTPTALLASSRLPRGQQRSTASGTDAAPSLPRGAFAAEFQGRLATNPTAGGYVIVSIDGEATGGFSGRIHVALRGLPSEGGGVELVDSTVGLLPRGANSWYAGRVVALEGQTVVARIAAADGQTTRVVLALQIDQGSSRVTGRVLGGTHGLGEDEFSQ